MISTLLSTSTGDGSGASIDIASNIDSTYDHYMFVLTDIHPETANQFLFVQFNESGETGYNENMTTTVHALNSQEAGTDATGMLYIASQHQGDGTDYQYLSRRVSADADESTSGILHLFNPASTTYNATFYSRMGNDFDTDGTKYYESGYMSGFIHNAAAIDEISFKFGSGNMNGTIQMYGIA